MCLPCFPIRVMLLTRITRLLKWRRSLRLIGSKHLLLKYYNGYRRQWSYTAFQIVDANFVSCSASSSRAKYHSLPIISHVYSFCFLAVEVGKTCCAARLCFGEVCAGCGCACLWHDVTLNDWLMVTTLEKCCWWWMKGMKMESESDYRKETQYLYLGFLLGPELKIDSLTCCLYELSALSVK